MIISPPSHPPPPFPFPAAPLSFSCLLVRSAASRSLPPSTLLLLLFVDCSFYRVAFQFSKPVYATRERCFPPPSAKESDERDYRADGSKRMYIVTFREAYSRVCVSRGCHSLSSLFYTHTLHCDAPRAHRLRIANCTRVADVNERVVARISA